MVLYAADIGEGWEEYISLNPKNIKSAETGTNKENIGTFSKYDDDIRHSRVLNNNALDYADRLRQTSREWLPRSAVHTPLPYPLPVSVLFSGRIQT